MRTLLSFLFTLPLITISIDESYFENQNGQCICAVKPNVCNPYCLCDPFCTDDQKKEFNFYLPESFSNSKIACDSKKSISKVNLKSIKEEMPNCYSIEGKEDGKKIENYDPKDFGLEDYKQAVDSPFTQDKYISTGNDYYTLGEKIIGSNTGEKQYFYLPIAIGSSTSNALIPIRFGINYPKYNCRIDVINPRSYVTSDILIRRVYDPSGVNETANFSLFTTVRDDIRYEQYLNFLDLQFIFRTNETTNEFYNITIKRIPNSYRIPGNPNSFMAFTSEVFFGSESNFYDNIYQSTNMGYYYGTPVMKDTNKNSKLSYTDLFGGYRAPLQVANITNVLFGVNSTVIIPLGDSNYQNVIFPLHKRIYKSFGHIILNENYVNEYFVEFNESKVDRKNVSGLKTPIATWKFIYKEFRNQNNVPVYFLQDFYVFVLEPETGRDKVKAAIVKTEFFEYDASGKLRVPEEIRFHSQSYSTLFDLFFRDTEESLNTIGVLFCFALMGTLWCWYVCFFYIED